MTKRPSMFIVTTTEINVEDEVEVEAVEIGVEVDLVFEEDGDEKEGEDDHARGACRPTVQAHGLHMKTFMTSGHYGQHCGDIVTAVARAGGGLGGHETTREKESENESGAAEEHDTNTDTNTRTLRLG
ncbi:hypothetical protein PV08_09373 [Exophiala spinifera]|uniref:Uncharacterized protein n=1 Tax=Exophiala spinifera TaxID=91928 RepID=A0A0D2BLQ0_9EURO|nr:uncharacterized protein PV08_09373 [Exophiala spinifera]KIW12099.1 hypothetical protein PV08_09373 [Exophiala spinifera]